MNSLDDAVFRLELAQGYLSKAERDARDQRWDDCLANAQNAVENAGKSVLSHFRPVPKTHDVVNPLRSLLEQPGVAPSVQAGIREALGAFDDMGLETHVRAAYGDEATHTPPWELIEEPEARAGLDKARRAIALAEAVIRVMTDR